MLAQLEALLALEELGTMTRAATRLRVTQSAVSKRIAALEAEVGARVVERRGRALHLTGLGRELAGSARPLVATLRGLVASERAEHAGRIGIAVTESILASWGAPLLARLRERLPKIEVVVHAHRGPVALDAVRSGRALLGLVGGRAPSARELAALVLGEERLVIVPSRLAPLALRRGATIDLLEIEPSSLTARATQAARAPFERASGIRLRTTGSVGSYVCLVQMARAGLGNALVPEPLADALGVSAASRTSLPAPGLARPVFVAARKTSLERSLVAAFLDALREEVAAAGVLRPIESNISERARARRR